MSEAKIPAILMVDDEPLVLAGYRRTIGRTFSLTCAEGGPAALAAIDAAVGNPFAVIVTDMRMPQMNGLEFITAARAKSRDSVYLMLTGNADQQTAVDAINRGQIFRFLNKPCPSEMLEGALRSALRQHELLTAERVLLRDTFTGSIKFMSEALELANPELFAFQSLVKQIVAQCCEAIGVRCDWNLYVASSLCLIGLMTIPGLSARTYVSDETLEQACATGSKLLTHIPRINPVVELIRRQREPLPPLPTDVRVPDAGANYEALGIHLLRLAVDLAREQRRTNDRLKALEQLIGGGIYDARLTSALLVTLRAAADTTAANVVQVGVGELVSEMVSAADLRKSDGGLLVTRGQVLSDLAIASLRNAHRAGLIDASIAIWQRPTAISTDRAAA